MVFLAKRFLAFWGNISALWFLLFRPTGFGPRTQTLFKCKFLSSDPRWISGFNIIFDSKTQIMTRDHWSCWFLFVLNLSLQSLILNDCLVYSIIWDEIYTFELNWKLSSRFTLKTFKFTFHKLWILLRCQLITSLSWPFKGFYCNKRGILFFAS